MIFFSGQKDNPAAPAQPVTQRGFKFGSYSLICLTFVTGLCATSPAADGHTVMPESIPAVHVRISPPPVATPSEKGRYGQLSASALADYRNIQQALIAGDWVTFTKLLDTVSDPRLVASFNALKLLKANTASSGPAMAEWLKNNKSHPMAPAVLAQAQTVLSPAERRQLPSPTAIAALSGGDSEADGRSTTRNAPEALMGAVVKFFGGNDTGAREAAKDNEAPLALWTTGLAAWRQGDISAARDAFTRMTSADGLHTWDRASAYFWTGRANAKLGDRENANRNFRQAAKIAPRSFYGLLAAQSLGTTPEFSWRVPAPAASDLKEISSLPNGERALMWLELGDRRLAEAELRQSVARANASQRRALLLLAEAEKMPNLSYGLSLYARGKYAELRLPSLYPVPAWEPDGGFATSPALVFAFMRQESGFNPHAHSSAGAQGAMQMMPDTAARMARTADERLAIKASLSQPETSIELGERYMQTLARDGSVRNNLLKLIAAYNCGTGNLQRWSNELPLGGEKGSDPLLFVESIPARETRDFVETVMANYWMYQLRLQQETPSLKTLAAGDWPRFKAEDPTAQLASAH